MAKEEILQNIPDEINAVEVIDSLGTFNSWGILVGFLGLVFIGIYFLYIISNGNILKGIWGNISLDCNDKRSIRKTIMLLLPMLAISVVFLTFMVDTYVLSREVEGSETLCYITVSGEKYHEIDCKYFDSDSPIHRVTTIYRAEKEGFTKCSRCNFDKDDVCIQHSYGWSAIISILICAPSFLLLIYVVVIKSRTIVSVETKKLFFRRFKLVILSISSYLYILTFYGFLLRKSGFSVIEFEFISLFLICYFVVLLIAAFPYCFGKASNPCTAVYKIVTVFAHVLSWVTLSQYLHFYTDGTFVSFENVQILSEDGMAMMLIVGLVAYVGIYAVKLFCSFLIEKITSFETDVLYEDDDNTIDINITAIRESVIVIAIFVVSTMFGITF